MWEHFSQAFALMLIFEGVLPFANPNKWRETMLRITEMPEQSLRVYGFASMLFGVIILWLLHQ